jgi:signal transduction histidine kinase
VQTLVRQTLALVEHRAAQIGVALCEDLPSDPIQIEADPGQLKQVFLNILMNALDASPAGSTVTVRASVAPPPNEARADEGSSSCLRQAKIEIIDTGSGVPSDLGDRIFDAFVSTKETGTGLGLAICRRIVDDHGGELSVSNRSGKGTVFTIQLNLNGSSHETFAP